MERDGRAEGKRPHQRLGVAGLAVMLSAVVMMACHPWYNHIDGIESVDDVENACVDWDVTETPVPTGIDFASARSTIQGILEDDARGWEAVSSKINFVVAADDCDTLAENDRVEQEIEYRILNIAAYPSFCGGGPCILPQTGTETSHGSWTDYTKMRVFLAYTDLRVPDTPDDLIKSILNHETGHAIGFKDPIRGVDVGAPYWVGQEGCVVNYEGSLVWNVSIMHNANHCAGDVQRAGSPVPAVNLPWPSFFDLQLARWITDQ